jgi:hypothetical protein
MASADCGSYAHIGTAISTKFTPTLWLGVG